MDQAVGARRFEDDGAMSLIFHFEDLTVETALVARNDLPADLEGLAAPIGVEGNSAEFQLVSNS